MTYQHALEGSCNRHKKKFIQHEYYEMVADTYNFTDERAKRFAKGVAKRMESSL